MTRSRINAACNEAENGDWTALLMEFAEENKENVDLQRLLPSLPALARRDILNASDVVAVAVTREQERKEAEKVQQRLREQLKQPDYRTYSAPASQTITNVESIQVTWNPTLQNFRKRIRDMHRT